MIRVEARRDVRFCRRKEIDPDSEDAFFERDLVDTQNKGLTDLLIKADYSIHNNEDLTALYKQVDITMERLKESFK